MNNDNKKTFGDKIKAFFMIILNAIKKGLVFIKEKTVFVFKKIGNFFLMIGRFFKKVFGPFFSMIGRFFKKVGLAIKNGTVFVLQKIGAFFVVIGRFFKKVFGPFFSMIGRFLAKRVAPILRKIGYALTHNFVLNTEGLYVRIFKFIKIRKTKKNREAFFGYLFISLWLVGFAVFTIYPMFYSLDLSFNTAYYSLTSGVSKQFVGFDNYLNVFRDSTLLPLFGAHIGKMLLAVPLIIIFSIIIAVLINNPIKLKGFWRTIFFLPVVISTGPVINELTAQGATTLPALAQSGVMEFIQSNVGEWLASPLEIVLNSMLSILWYAGIPILIFLAGLQKVDQSIYEAASIDGASPWDTFWKITLPTIKPLISVSIIYTVVSISLFVETGGILDLVKTHMVEGGPHTTLWHGYGYAAAIAWIYFILMVLIIGVFVGITSIKRRERA